MSAALSPVFGNARSRNDCWRTDCAIHAARIDALGRRGLRGAEVNSLSSNSAARRAARGRGAPIMLVVIAQGARSCAKSSTVPRPDTAVDAADVVLERVDECSFCSMPATRLFAAHGERGLRQGTAKVSGEVFGRWLAYHARGAARSGGAVGRGQIGCPDMERRRGPNTGPDNDYGVSRKGLLSMGAPLVGVLASTTCGCRPPLRAMKGGGPRRRSSSIAGAAEIERNGDPGCIPW